MPLTKFEDFSSFPNGLPTFIRDAAVAVLSWWSYFVNVGNLGRKSKATGSAVASLGKSLLVSTSTIFGANVDEGTKAVAKYHSPTL